MHKYTNGLHTASAGISIDAFRVTGLNGASPTVAEDAHAQLIQSVANSTGTYTFQMTLPYPPKLVACIPHITAGSITEDILVARYKEGSYNATTGQFVIFVSNDDDSGAPIAASGTASNELHVILVTNRYTH